MEPHRSASEPAGQASDSSAPAVRRGRLRHGNPPGDYAAAPRCGAKARAGHTCRQPAMKNGRCRLHGGKSTGARTPEGLARCRQVNLIHGARTAEMIELRAAAARSSRVLLALTRTTGHLLRAQRRSERATSCPATDGAMARLAPAETEPQIGRTTPYPATPAPAAPWASTSAEPQSERTTPCPATFPPAEPKSAGRLKSPGFARKCLPSARTNG